MQTDVYVTADYPQGGTNGNQSAGGNFLASLSNLANNIVTTYGTVLEKKIEAKYAPGLYPQNANPGSSYNQPSGQIVAGVENKTLLAVGAVSVALVVGALLLTRK